MHSPVVLLLVSLVFSSAQAGRYYSSPKYSPIPPPPVIRHHVTPVVHHVAPVVLPAPAPVVRTVQLLPAAPAPVLAAPLPVVPLTATSQFHAQDELGQASFGYSHPGQAAVTHRDANGNMAGSWSYINPEGKEVRVSYIADALGFRVVSNDLPIAPVAAAPAVALPAPLPIAQPLPVALPVGPAPVQDTPEVVEAKLAHFAAVAEARSRGRRHAPSYGGSYHRSYPKPARVVVHAAPQPAPVIVRQAPLPVVHAAPLPIVHAAPAPIVVAAPAPATITKFHSQDELGQASFGFSTPDQTQTNFRDINGNQVGSYSYINPEGQEIVVHYSAGRDGFQVLSNALPVAPANVVLQDTPDVVAAKNLHFALFNEALLRNQQQL